MARYFISVLFLAVATIHAVASRVGVGGEDQATDGQEGWIAASEDAVYPCGRGRDIKEYVANVRQKMLERGMRHETSGDLAVPGSSGNSSLLEEADNDACPSPLEAFPDIFTDIDYVGSGGFGEAFSVRINACTATGKPLRPLVLKAMQKDREDRAWVEVLLAESFDDAEPGLVTSFAHTKVQRKKHRSCMFMLMEYADSGDLHTKLREQTLSIEEKALIFYEALDGLRTLHKRGLVHRDIKPNNIFMLDETYTHHLILTGHKYHPLIGDYGLTCCGRSKGCGEVQPGISRQLKLPYCDRSWAGTLGYISPRVAAGEKATPEDDLWAMGKVLLQMVSNTHRMVYTLPERQLLLFMDKEEAYLENLAAYAGSPELASFGETLEKNMKSMKGGLALQKLLKYLLCNGCDRVDAPEEYRGYDKKTMRDEMTFHAMKLTQNWLEELGVKPEVVPDLDRPKLDDI